MGEGEATGHCGGGKWRRRGSDLDDAGQAGSRSIAAGLRLEAGRQDDLWVLLLKLQLALQEELLLLQKNVI